MLFPRLPKTLTFSVLFIVYFIAHIISVLSEFTFNVCRVWQRKVKEEDDIKDRLVEMTASHTQIHLCTESSEKARPEGLRETHIERNIGER